MEVHLNVRRINPHPALSRALLRQVTASLNPEAYVQIRETLCADFHVNPKLYRISSATCIIGGTLAKIAPPEVTLELGKLIEVDLHKLVYAENKFRGIFHSTVSFAQPVGAIV
jgi:hypothetical protein